MKFNDQRFNDWLTGFFEGDGSVYLHKQKISSYYTANLRIAFGQKDHKMLKALQKKIGGNLRLHTGVKNKKNWILFISSRGYLLDVLGRLDESFLVGRKGQTLKRAKLFAKRYPTCRVSTPDKELFDKYIKKYGFTNKS